LSTQLLFDAFEKYVLGGVCMPNFKKDNMVLLKVLRDLITENMDASKINPFLDHDVSEFITDITDKRRFRRLRDMRRALDTYIEAQEVQERLMERQRIQTEARLKKANEAYRNHCDADQ
jgi:hypothetical protein